MLDAVYKDIKPEAARIGKTVDVYFPDIGPLQAINNGQLTPTSVNPNYIPLVFQTRAGAALQFQDFEQWQTAVDLAQKFFDPLYKRAKEFLNGQIAALITTSNFNSNAPIIGAAQGEVQVADQLNAWNVLADQKVPLEDSRQAAPAGAQQRVPEDARRLGVGSGEPGFGRDRPRGSRDVPPGACLQLPAGLGSADADGDRHDPLRSGHGHQRLGNGDRPEHCIHSAARPPASRT